MDTRNADRTTSCTFCELIHGSAEVSICYEDADAIAFMDIQPVNDGHVLVVPRAHHESLLDVPEELGAHLFKVTMRLANAIRQVTGSTDMNIVVNSGAAAGQDEPHYHVHIIPRREDDGFDIPLPFNGSKMPDRTVLDAHAVRIMGALRDPMRAAGSEDRTSRHAKPTVSRAQRASTIVGGDRPVDVRVFDETVNAAAAEASLARPSQRWRVDEGAHGELVYEPRADDGVA